MLKIITSAEPINVTRLNVVLYGPPGLGKTTLAFTADKPLLLDFDSGSHRAANRKDTVRPSCWADVAGITADDIKAYSTIIVDTAGRALDMLAADIIAKDPKKGNGGALSLQGYGVLKSQFSAFLKMLNSFGKDVVLIAHAEEQRSGDDLIERLDVQGGSKGEIYKSADAMGRLAIRGGKRWLSFSPTDASFGKNPAQLDPIEVPSPAEMGALLGKVIATTKEKMNTLSAEQKEAQDALQSDMELWSVKVNDASDVESFNAFLKSAKGAHKEVKKLIVAAAEKNGFVLNKKSLVFEVAA